MKVLGYLLLAYLIASILAATAVTMFPATPPHPHAPEGLSFFIILASPALPYFYLEDVLSGKGGPTTQVLFWTVFVVSFLASVVFLFKRKRLRGGTSADNVEA
jgi:hypothetical protein